MAGRGRRRGPLLDKDLALQHATNRCHNFIRDGRRRAPAEPVPPFDPPEPSRRGDVTWLQPYPDAWLEQVPDGAPGPAAGYDTREAMTLAFVAALQRLAPRQTAALLLCDVLGYSNGEAAAMLATSPTSVKASCNGHGRRSTGTSTPQVSVRRLAPTRHGRSCWPGASPTP